MDDKEEDGGNCLGLIIPCLGFKCRLIVTILPIMAKILGSYLLCQTQKVGYTNMLCFVTHNALTVITHLGIISLLSYMAVLAPSLARYFSSLHIPRSFRSLQNIR